MKLPFSPGLNFVFRLLIPGVVLAAFLIDAFKVVLNLDEADSLLVFTILAISSGWFLTLVDMQIYMLFEGRRFWPSYLRKLGLKREGARLARLEKLRDRAVAEGDDHLNSELARELFRFPLEQGKPVVRCPTRLGNVVAAFEEYPERLYGLNSSVFWHRLWIELDKDLRDEIDTKQAVVDCALYVAFALAIGAIIAFVYFIFALFGIMGLTFAEHHGKWLFVVAICPILSFLIYRASLEAQTSFGDLFKAVFDQRRHALKLDEIARHIDAIYQKAYVGEMPERIRNRHITQYLEWNELWPQDKKGPITPEEYTETQFKE